VAPMGSQQGGAYAQDGRPRPCRQSQDPLGRSHAFDVRPFVTFAVFVVMFALI
jgi:hypothetical protein